LTAAGTDPSATGIDFTAAGTDPSFTRTVPSAREVDPSATGIDLSTKGVKIRQLYEYCRSVSYRYINSTATRKDPSYLKTNRSDTGK
jgi:hypothetical protein